MYHFILDFHACVAQGSQVLDALGMVHLAEHAGNKVGHTTRRESLLAGACRSSKGALQGLRKAHTLISVAHFLNVHMLYSPSNAI